jgi:hypothetical protein
LVSQFYPTIAAIVEHKRLADWVAVAAATWCQSGSDFWRLAETIFWNYCPRNTRIHAKNSDGMSVIWGAQAASLLVLAASQNGLFFAYAIC